MSDQSHLSHSEVPWIEIELMSLFVLAHLSYSATNTTYK